MPRRVPLHFPPMRSAFHKIAASQETGLVVVLALVTIMLTLLAGSHVDRATGHSVNNFWNSYTLIQTATDASFFAIMAIGATVVIISGGIDLSVGSIYALSGVTLGLVLRGAGRHAAPRRRRCWALRCASALAWRVESSTVCSSSDFACIRSSSRSERCGCCAASRSWRRRRESILVPPALTSVIKASLGLGRRPLSHSDVGDARRHDHRCRLPHAHGDGPPDLCVWRQRRGEPVCRIAAQANSDRRLRRVGPDRWPRGVPRRQLLWVGVVGRCAGLRAVRHRVGGRRRRELDRRQGQRAWAQRSARCSSCSFDSRFEHCISIRTTSGSSLAARSSSRWSSTNGVLVSRRVASRRRQRSRASRHDLLHPVPPSS